MELVRHERFFHVTPLAGNTCQIFRLEYEADFASFEGTDESAKDMVNRLRTGKPAQLGSCTRREWAKPWNRKRSPAFHGGEGKICAAFTSLPAWPTRLDLSNHVMFWILRAVQEFMPANWRSQPH